MSLYNEIDQLKSSVNQTATETLPPGYIAGFDLSVIDARIYCGPGICNYNGKKMTFPTGRYLLDSEWVSKNKLPETVYYVYLTTGAAFFVDLNAPDFSALQFGDYHPTLGYRYIGKAKTNAHGVIDIVANSRNIIAENIDFEAIEGSRIKSQTIESKQLIIGDQVEPEGDPIPEDVELFRYNDLSCASTLGTRPVSKNVKLEQGDIGSVENPWYYERRWTVPKGLVAAYTMNAGVGTVLRDDSGNFRDATITGLAWNASGHQGYCLSSSAYTDKFSVSSAPAITGPFSLCVWTYRTGDAYGNATIFDVGDYSANTGFGLWIQDTGGGNPNYITIRINQYYNLYSTIAEQIPLNTWTQYVFTYTGSAVNLYKNGASAPIYTAAYSTNPTTATTMQAFKREGAINEGFRGLLDDIQVYNRALTTTEISALYAETSPYTDVNAAPCDNAIWCGKTTTNLVATTDLNDSTKWDFNDTYQSNRGNVFDPELLKTVWKWNKGTNASISYLYDTNYPVLGAGTYVVSLMYRCNYDTTVVPAFYSVEEIPVQFVPANTWTLLTSRKASAAGFTGIAWVPKLPGGGNFPADIEFRACDPYVALESYPMPFAPTTRPAASLWYNYTWPQQGTVGFWVKPQFNFDVATGMHIISDFFGASFKIQISYSPTTDKFSLIMNGTSPVAIAGTAMTSNADLKKWWFIAGTWDVANDSLKLYCYNADYPTGDNAASTSDLGTVAFNNYLSVGAIPLYTSPATYESNSLIAGLFIDDTVWTEEELKAHYDSGRVYYDPNVIQNYSRGVAIDKNGILIKDGSLNIIDNYGREIDISNQSGLMAKDSSGQIIHDIPNAANLAGAYTMGHLYVYNATVYGLISSTTYSSNWTLATGIMTGITNVKGVRIKACMSYAWSSAHSQPISTLGLRPYGSTYETGVAATSNEDHLSIGFNASATTSLVRICIIDTPVDSLGRFEYKTITTGTPTTFSITLFQIGVWV